MSHCPSNVCTRRHIGDGASASFRGTEPGDLTVQSTKLERVFDLEATSLLDFEMPHPLFVTNEEVE